MNLNIRITGAAWAWVNSTVDIIADIFAWLGYDLITDIEYESRIKWWVNFFDVSLSDKGEKFLTKKVGILLALNAQSFRSQINFLKPWATIIINSKWLKKLEDLDLKNYNILDLEIKDKYDNTYLIWILAKYLNLDLDVILDKIKIVFSRKWETIVISNQNIIKNIYNTYIIDINKQSKIKIERVWKAKETIYWNKALSYWAIASDLEYYAAYPMTPASTILSEIINSKKITYLQAEDEIAVVNSTLWASFTGKRSMCWTSGWGFALMTEGISFAVQAEFPLVVVLSMRAGPSTGTPTYHEAWDINFALHPTFGDFEHVVMYPSSLEEAYYFWWLALNIADKYQTQVIFLMDKQSSELVWTTSELIAPKTDRWEIIDKPKDDYKRYELNDSWISPRVKVWTKNGDFISTSYEHDEYWATSEDSENRMRMTEKRWRKLENFFKKEWYKWYEVINSKAKKILIVYSFTAYTAKEFVKRNPEFWLIIIKFLKPLDHRLVDEIKWKEEVIFIESNYSGQVEKYITNELGLKFVDNLKISNLRKYDLFPFYIEDFEKLIK